jgi:SAM-dependent MidA family methyltransferase
MQESLYGERGFYRSAGAPARHFRTAARVGPQWASALLTLASSVDAALGTPEGFALVDLGAGGGELLDRLAALAPARWRLVGVDVAERPRGLAGRVDWQAELPERLVGVLTAVEWLDVVPLDVAIVDDDGGLRLVEVDARGNERAGALVSGDELAWQQRWWPVEEPGDRVELGTSRDAAWADAVARLERGVALAVDYAAVAARDLGGTLTGYRDGRQVPPVPDGSCDLTEHVLMESCAVAAGGTETALLSQRDALRRLGVSARRPVYAGEPAAYLSSLSAAGDAAELLDPGGLGGFTWLLHARGVPLPVMSGSAP